MCRFQLQSVLLRNLRRLLGKFQLLLALRRHQRLLPAAFQRRLDQVDRAFLLGDVAQINDNAANRRICGLVVETNLKPAGNFAHGLEYVTHRYVLQRHRLPH